MFPFIEFAQMFPSSSIHFRKSHTLYDVYNTSSPQMFIVLIASHDITSKNELQFN